MKAQVKTEKSTGEIDFGCAKIEVEIERTVKHTKKRVINQLPPLPYDLWQQIVSYMAYASKEKNAEAIVSLTLVNKKWEVICWHQYAQGTLHIKFDQSSEENQALLTDEMKEALITTHCTIHSHNKAGAGQSGDDKDDELGKEGWHITVGTCDKPTLSTHARFNCKQIADFDANGKKVRGAFQEFVLVDIDNIVEAPKIPKKYRQFMATTASLMSRNHAGVPFPEEWKERHKEQKKTTYSGTRSWTSPQTSSGGTGTHTGATASSRKHFTTFEETSLNESRPFQYPVNIKSPEWVLAQMVFSQAQFLGVNLEEESSLISKGENLLYIAQEAIQNAEMHFQLDLACDPIEVSDAFPYPNELANMIQDAGSKYIPRIGHNNSLYFTNQEVAKLLRQTLVEGDILNDIAIPAI